MSGSFDECEAAAADAIANLGRIDVLCNNAGVARLVPFLEMSDEERDFQFDVNIKGVWNCTKAVLPNMRKNKYGRIVMMSSVTGPMVANEGETAYATTKAAVWGFTKALALEVVKDNITVNAICPGMIRTPMVENAVREFSPDNPDAILGHDRGHHPHGRTGQHPGDRRAGRLPRFGRVQLHHRARRWSSTGAARCRKTPGRCAGVVSGPPAPPAPRASGAPG